MTLHWLSACSTHPGKRRSHNEDAVLNRPQAGLWAIADGMGGHADGDFASASVRDELDRLCLRGPLAKRVDAVEDSLVAVNDHLRCLAAQRSDGSIIGTTVVAMVATDATGVVLWAGDSRLYRLRGSRLEQITRDHNPIADLLDSGTVTEAEALEAETNVITRAVGGQRDLHLDIGLFDIAPGDVFLLCSDGLYRELDAACLRAALRLPAPEASVAQLLEAGLASEARDNLSFVVVRPCAGSAA